MILIIFSGRQGLSIISKSAKGGLNDMLAFYFLGLAEAHLEKSIAYLL